jgi:outer membrane protein assembly factor BamB
MTTEVRQYKWGSNRLWNRVATVAGVFALLICVLLVANYIQVKKSDPVNMTVINNLVERLYENPADSSLRKEIRTLDLLSRKAYFTSQWQIRTGGYLLLVAIALLVISLQIVDYRKKITPVISADSVDETMVQNRKARQWIVIGGGIILLTAVAFGMLSSNDLAERLNNPGGDTGGSYVQDIAGGNITVTDLADGTPAMADSLANPAEKADAAAVTPEEPVPAVSTDNFPNFRGTGGYGTTPKRNIPVNWDGKAGTNILWKTVIPLPGHNSPVVWGDGVFIAGATAARQEVYCFDRNSGKIIWTVPVGTGTKKPTVTEETGFAAPTAVADGNGVYVIFSTGDIVGVDLNGKKMWERDLGLPENYYGYASSLMLYNGTIIIQYDQRSSQKIMALSAKTGKTVWSTDRKVKISWSSPILVRAGEKTEIITVAEPEVIAYDAANGAELWKIDCINGEVGPSLAYANGIVFAVNDYSKLSAIRMGDQPTILWENNEYLSDIPSPAATDKYLFVATSYGMVACYDALTGQKYWEKDFGKSIYSSPMIVENKVYVLDITGTMHIFNAAKEFILTGEPKLGENSASTPAFTDGRIYLRGEGNLYCIGK